MNRYLSVIAWVVLIGVGIAAVPKHSTLRKPEVIYRIPPAKQEAAAQMMVQLTQSLTGGGWSPSHVAEIATKQVLAIYGEPVMEAKP